MSRRPRRPLYIHLRPSGPRRASKSRCSARTSAAAAGSSGNRLRSGGAFALASSTMSAESAKTRSPQTSTGAVFLPPARATGIQWNHLKVSPLLVVDACPVERPTSLLAEVTDRNRDQNRTLAHCNSVPGLVSPSPGGLGLLREPAVPPVRELRLRPRGSRRRPRRRPPPGPRSACRRRCRGTLP